MTHALPTRAGLKAQARRLRDSLAATGVAMTHAQALETIARQWGARDWNTLSALAPETPAPRWQVGQAVRGRYLGHAFTGRIKAAQEASGGYWSLTVVFDTPVDVVASDKFSSFRRQVRCTLNGQGATVEKTSDGTPHMVLFAA